MEPDAEWERSCARLTIDLGAIKRNHAFLSQKVGSAQCAAVLKANAYGVGLREVAQSLAPQADCFFVAHPREGRDLRAILPQARIFVLHGCSPMEAPALAGQQLIPVLNTLEQARGWAEFCQSAGTNFPAALQYDTGMTRFGLTSEQVQASVLQELDIVLQMSHLACADTPEHPANFRQREKFLAMSAHFPTVARSLAASSGIFLGKEFHFDLVRPGAGLYGLAPNDQKNPLESVLTLEAPVLQLLEAVPGMQAGYGGTWEAETARQLATVGIGYADGFLRSLGNRGQLWFEGQPLPVAGRVSMDSVMVDITALKGQPLKEGDWVTVLGAHQDLDALGAAAGTSGYEILTSLSTRFARRYVQK